MACPTPEPVATPRAREGLRAVVPTIFPPSTVNRGESVRVRSSELYTHELQLTSLQQTTSEGLVHLPKKRGPKPKRRFKDSSCPVGSEPYKGRAEEEASHIPHKLTKLQEAEEIRLVKVSHRQPEIHGHSHKHHHHHHHHQSHNQGISSGSSHKPLYSDRSLYSYRTDMDTHRTKDSSSLLTVPHFKHQSNTSQNQSRPAKLPQMDKPYFLDRPSPTRLNINWDEVTWRPCLSNVEKVLVTDVTSNFLTVTIKESSTSEGFFKDKR